MTRTEHSITTPARDQTSRESRLRVLFSFPNPVNEVSARLVAGGVLLMVVFTIAFDLRWATAVIAYGFVAQRPSPGRASAHSVSSSPG